MKKAVCLFSGGLDSTTCLYRAAEDGLTPIALSIHYGQRHAREIASAEAIARTLDVLLYRVNFEMPWKGSALTDMSEHIPSRLNPDEILTSPIPSTYVPARNTIFLSLALSCAEATGARVIYFGANHLDYSGYPDCRENFIQTFEKLAKQGTKLGDEGGEVRILAPLLKMGKKEIVEEALRLGVPLDKTWSCYRGGERPCGECDSCLLRKKGFEEAGVKDPLL